MLSRSRADSLVRIQERVSNGLFGHATVHGQDWGLTPSITSLNPASEHAIVSKNTIASLDQNHHFCAFARYVNYSNMACRRQR